MSAQIAAPEDLDQVTALGTPGLVTLADADTGHAGSASSDAVMATVSTGTSTESLYS